MYKLLFLPLLISLTGCQSSTLSAVESESFLSLLSEHNYDEIETKNILWDDLFDQTSDDYYVYVYSKTCSHCNNIKDTVIETALNYENFFFVNFNQDIPILESIDTTIGAKEVDDVGILGTPTLLEIYFQTLILNVAGEDQVVKKLAKLS